MASSKAKVVNIGLTHTGIKVTRNGYEFTANWKLKKSLTAQQIRWRRIGRDTETGPEVKESWIKNSIDKTSTSETIDFSSILSAFRATYYKEIEVQLRGKVNGDWSEWHSYLFTIANKPTAPTLTYELTETAGEAEWTWNVESPADDHDWITSVEYQTIYQNDASGNPPETEWSNATLSTKALTGTAMTTNTILAGKSVTRFVRVRSKGKGGYSDWTVGRVVFATPNAPQITSHNVTYDASNHYLNLAAEWTVSYNQQRPVDTTMLQYRIGKPAANMGVTTDGSWTDVSSTGRQVEAGMVDAGGGSSLVVLGNTLQTSTSSMQANLTATVAADECVWLRAISRHEGSFENPGTPVLAYVGYLAAPTNLVISAQDDSTHTVTLACTNNSAVTDSKVAIVYQPNTEDECIVAVFPHGTSSMSGIKCPNWDDAGTLGFRAYAFVGSESYTTIDSVKYYTVNARMTSDVAFTSGGIPKAPTGVTLKKSPDEAVGIRVTWNWTWTEANKAEVSWSTRKNAWNSTSQPDTYTVDATNGGILDIGELTAGVTYYVRVRLLYDDGESISYGPYSATGTIYLSERPAVPVVSVSSDVVSSKTPALTVTWTYVSMDGTEQIGAKVAELSSGTYTVIAYADAEQHVTIDTSAWADGSQHDICVNVTSASNETSSWSAPVTVLKAEPPECNITQASLTESGGEYILDEMPMTVTVTGAGNAGTTNVSVIRSATFIQLRPDETQQNGFEGEIVLQREYSGESQQTFNLSDIIEGRNLDDTATYRLIAMVTDRYGQVATDAVDFTVSWSHQAVMPTGSAVIDEDIAKITVGTPTGTASGDTVDIYRLAADKPVLIYQGADFGDVVVDPFPTIGAHGGYRLVFRTKNGDYTTANKEFAWLDIQTDYEPAVQIIDFAGSRLLIAYNVDLGETSEKDFKKTKYLGGHIEGDWLAGADRKGSISGVVLTEEDVEDVEVLDDLMDYSGPARVRNKSGNHYLANINVDSSGTYTTGAKMKTVTLTIDRVDNTGLEGQLLAEWSA